eukprot:1347903-Rhodomonas_salina.2
MNALQLARHDMFTQLPCWAVKTKMTDVPLPRAANLSPTPQTGRGTLADVTELVCSKLLRTNICATMPGPLVCYEYPSIEIS